MQFRFAHPYNGGWERESKTLIIKDFVAICKVIPTYTHMQMPPGQWRVQTFLTGVAQVGPLTYAGLA